MRIVIQRVSQASVTINGTCKAQIGKGYMILLGIENNDTSEDIDWLVKKIIGLRVFDDEQGIMNLDIKTIDGEILLISQFTLFASCKKGNRPSWLRAAPHNISIYRRHCIIVLSHGVIKFTYIMFNTFNNIINLISISCFSLICSRYLTS